MEWVIDKSLNQDINGKIVEWVNATTKDGAYSIRQTRGIYDGSVKYNLYKVTKTIRPKEK